MPLAVVHLACDFLYGQTVYVPIFQHQLGFRIGEATDGVVDGPSQAQKPVHFLGNPRLPKAVSYTHLDVYKRQGRGCVPSGRGWGLSREFAGFRRGVNLLAMAHYRTHWPLRFTR